MKQIKLYPSNRRLSDHRPGRRQARHFDILQISLRLAIFLADTGGWPSLGLGTGEPKMIVPLPHFPGCLQKFANPK